MSLRVAVQMDPLETINITGDSSFALMEAAQARGHTVPTAALAAEGISNVTNVQLISRGYENFLQKLTDLGADFTYTE